MPLLVLHNLSILGIPVVKHKEHGCYVATMIFGQLLTVRVIGIVPGVYAGSYVVLKHSNALHVLHRDPTSMTKRRRRPADEMDTAPS